MKACTVAGSLVLALAMLTSCGVPEQEGSVSGLACGQASQPACRVTFRAIAADRHQYDGRIVRIEGYLGVSRGFFVVASSKELYEAGVSDEVEIRIRGRLTDQERIFKESAYSWVSAEGTFKVRKRNGTTDDLLLGELFVAHDVRPLMRGVEFRRQDFGKVVLELDDVNQE